MLDGRGLEPASPRCGPAAEDEGADAAGARGLILFRSRVRHRIDTPLRWQFQPTECGVAVLRIMLAWFGRDVPAHEVRRVTGVSRDCLNAADISRAARSFGLTCRARSLDTAALAKLELPVIVHLRFIHFAVLEAIDRRGVRLNCPHGGILEQPIELFDEAFTGVVLELSPGPRFARAEASRPGEPGWWLSLVSAAWLPALGATGCAVARAAGAGLVAFAAGAGQPDPAPVGWTAAGWIVAGVAIILMASAGERSMLRQSERRIHQTLQTRLVRQLQAVSFDFYAYRLPGALHAVMQLPRSLGAALVDRVAPAWHALLQCVLLLAVASLLDAGVGLALAASFAAWLGIVVALSRWRRGTERTRSDPTDAFIASRWHDYLQRAGRNRLAEGPDALRLETTGLAAARQLRRACVGPAPALLAAAPGLLMAACLAIVVAMGPGLPSAKSLGLILVAGMLALAATPLTRLRGVLEGLRRGGFMARDVLDEPVPPPAPEPYGEPRDASLTVDDVAFGFNPNKPPLIRRASLVMAPGEHLGLCGPPGSGKSTLTEIIMGLHQPQAGTVSIGGVPLRSLSPAARARLLARISRRPVVFEGTIRENLTLWDDEISEADLWAAIDDACLTDVVAERPGGLDAVVETEGRNFSGGQLQRLEIARALARRPAILIVDDALDALDPALESRVRSALRRRGCTVLVVSQRATSLAACDRVVHLAGGVVGERPDIAMSATSLPPPARNLPVHDTSPLAPHEPAPIGARAESLLAAMSIVLPGARAVTEDIGALAAGAAVARLARAYDHWVRPVRFTVPQWWREEAGPVLAFRKDGSPVAILPRATGPVLVDPKDSSHARVTSALIATLEPLAYTFEASGPTADGRARARFPASWSGAVRIEATRCLVISAVLAALSILFLAATAYADTPSRIAAIGALAAGAALLWHLHEVATARLLNRLDMQECTLLQHLALTVDGGAIRRLPPWRLSFAVGGLTGMAGRWTDALGGGFCAAALLCGACAGVAWLGGPVALAASAAGAALCLSPELASGMAARRSMRAYALARRTAQDRLAALLWGMSRARALNVADRILMRWRQDEEAETDFWRRTRTLTTWGWALTLPAGLCALGEAPLTVAAGWVVAGAAMTLGRIAAKTIADGPAARAARHLLELRRPDGARQVNPHEAGITADHMTFRYPAARAPLFNDLCLSIDPRAITVLAGPSGAGKSTLLRLLLGLEVPDSGTLRIGGHAAGEVELAAWQGRIAGVFQGDQLEGATTIRAQLSANTEVGPAEIWAALGMVEMAEEVRAMPMALQSIVETSRISAGEQQRLLIARALLRKPAVLVMDEATGAIPDDVQARLLERLRARGIGCLIVSHRETVIEAADQVHIIDGGRIVFSGAPDALGAHLPTATRSRQQVSP